jgi:hypothetical protein
MEVLLVIRYTLFVIRYFVNSSGSNPNHQSLTPQSAY